VDGIAPVPNDTVDYSWTATVLRKSAALVPGQCLLRVLSQLACHDRWNVSAPSRFTLYTFRAFSNALRFYRENQERQ
jgi:hypothetical protein